MMRVVTQLELYLYAAGTGFAMYPMTKLVGAGAVSRINSILVAPSGSHMDVGGRAILEAPGTKAEIIARTINTGGVAIHAVPKLEARTSNAELSREAAVGKIARRRLST